METTLEPQIAELLSQQLSSAEIAERLSQQLADTDLTQQEKSIREFCLFCLHAGHYQQLINFIVQHWSDPNFKFPWSLFIEAVSKSRPALSDFFVDELMHAITETQQLTEAARSKGLDLYTSTLKIERIDQKPQRQKQYQKTIQEALDQLLILRTQQLHEQERQLLRKLERLAPQKQEVLQEIRRTRDQQALDVLAKYSRFQKDISNFVTDLDTEVMALLPAVRQSLIEQSQQTPSLAYDFAITAAFLEEWETALTCLSFIPHSQKNSDWLRMEFLLAAKRFVEVLSFLPYLEQKYSQDPQTALALIYARAIALWNLGQKSLGLELLETLAFTKPHYRATSSLLEMWRRG